MTATILIVTIALVIVGELGAYHLGYMRGYSDGDSHCDLVNTLEKKEQTERPGPFGSKFKPKF